MPLFTYTATNKEGTLVSGTIDAVSAQAARQAVLDLGMQTVELHETTQSERTGPPQFDTPSFAPPLTPSVPADVAKPVQGSAKKAPTTAAPAYYPITKTLALYSGWLLAYYCFVYALGWYQHTRPLPFRIPYVEALLLSPLVLSFSFAAFLFLLVVSLHEYIGGGKLKGFFLALTGMIVFALYRVNVA